jgi:outer membrane receptor protein involved in Fe transport
LVLRRSINTHHQSQKGLAMKYSKFAYSWLAFSSLCSISNISYADEAITMPPVTVTASRGTNLDEMDVSTTVISHEQIQRAPELSIDQIINKIPGVFIPQQLSSALHPTGGTFSIRGFGSTTNVNTLVMVDGIPLNDPYFRTIDWTKIPKDSIERIEVIRGGGASSLWGNLAMGGIVNIVTREPQANEKRVNISYDSFNTKTLDTAVTVFANDKIKVGMGYDGIKTDGYNKTPEQFRNPYMDATSSEVDNIPISVYLTPTPDSKYYIKLLVHQIREKNLVWDGTKNTWDSYQISGGGTTKLSDSDSINLNGWYDNSGMATQNASLKNGGAAYTFNINNPSVGVPYVSQTEHSDYQSIGGSLFYGKELPNVKDIKIGVDGRDITAKDPLNLYSVTAQTAAITAKGEHNFEGIFAQGTYSPEGVPLDITLGLREDFWQAHDGSVSGTVNGAALNNVLTDQSYSHFDPRLGAKYYFDNGFAVRAAAYENFAAPGMNQMYRSFVGGSNYTSTNAALTPQTNFGQEIGVDYKKQWGDASFTLFNNKLDGFIDFATQCSSVATCNPLIAGTGLSSGSINRVNQYVNAGDATFRGAELLGNWQATNTVTLSAGLTYTDAYLTSSSYPAADPIGLQIGQVPKWLATLGGSWKPIEKLELGWQLKSFPSYWNNTAHTQKNDAATLLDASASYKINSGAEIYTIAQNIGNFKYYDNGVGYTTANGSIINTSTIPALGMPFNMTVGMRVWF